MPALQSLGPVTGLRAREGRGISPAGLVLGAATVPPLPPPVQEKWPAAREQELRNHLGSFGCKGGTATQPLRTLSGRSVAVGPRGSQGQPIACLDAAPRSSQSRPAYPLAPCTPPHHLTGRVPALPVAAGGQAVRVALAAAFYGRPHLLILDEPSNHLDLGGVESLAEALRQYGGSVLLVSHDQASAAGTARHCTADSAGTAWQAAKAGRRRWSSGAVGYGRSIRLPSHGVYHTP